MATQFDPKHVNINDEHYYTADPTRFILEGLAEIDYPSQIELVEAAADDDAHYIILVMNDIVFRVAITISDFL